LIDEALENVEDKVKVNGVVVNSERFSDDQAMVSNSNIGLQRIIDALNTTSVEYGMKINFKKTKVMRMCKSGRSNVNIMIYSSRVELVRQFTYVGNVITEDVKCHEEAKWRMAIGKVFSKRGELLRGKMKLELKTRIIKTLICSMTLYAAETWTLRKVDIQRLEAFEMWIWCRVMKISWSGRNTEHCVCLPAWNTWQSCALPRIELLPLEWYCVITAEKALVQPCMSCSHDCSLHDNLMLNE